MPTTTISIEVKARIAAMPWGYQVIIYKQYRGDEGRIDRGDILSFSERFIDNDLAVEFMESDYFKKVFELTAASFNTQR